MRERLGARSNVPRFLLQTNRGLSIAGDGGVGPFNRTKKVVGGKAELYPAMPGADIDALMEDGAFVHEDGIMLFPGQRRTAAPDIAGEGLDFLERDHLHVLVAGNGGEFLEVQLCGPGDADFEHPGLVAPDDQRFEDLLHRHAE